MYLPAVSANCVKLSLLMSCWCLRMIWSRW